MLSLVVAGALLLRQHLYICTSKASTKVQILTLLLRSLRAGLSLAVARALMLRQYLYVCTSNASKLSTCRAESGGCACADAAERDDAGAQFTCFTSTNVQILTLLPRSASMQVCNLLALLVQMYKY